MFEHLGYSPETRVRQTKARWSIYAGFFLVAFAFLVVSLTMSRGSKTIAEEASVLTAKVLVNNQPQVVVAQSPTLSLFDFVVVTDEPGVALQRLRVYFNGLYDPTVLQGLRLYHQGHQVGQLAKFDSDGYIYFETDGYKLNQGQNAFSLLLASSQLGEDNKVFQLSFEQPEDITLSYQSHLFTPDGNFPLLGGLVSLAEQGSLLASNNFDDPNFPVVRDVPQLISSFSLSNQGETVDLNKIVLGVESATSLAKREFILLSHGQVLAKTALSDQGKEIIFLPSKPIVINKTGQVDLEVHSLGLPKGLFTFSLTGVEAMGFISGAKINLSQPLALSQIESLDYYPEFLSGSPLQTLTTGWNELYSLKVHTHGETTLNLDKLTWSLVARGADLTNLEVWVDNKPIAVKIDFLNDQLVITSDQTNPLSVTSRGLELQILGKVVNLTKGAVIQTYLLTDQQPKLGTNLDYNILWSKDKNVFNSYNLPYLPLAPSVLTNSNF